MQWAIQFLITSLRFIERGLRHHPGDQDIYRKLLFLKQFMQETDCHIGHSKDP